MGLNFESRSAGEQRLGSLPTAATIHHDPDDSDTDVTHGRGARGRPGVDRAQNARYRTWCTIFGGAVAGVPVAARGQIEARAAGAESWKEEVGRQSVEGKE